MSVRFTLSTLSAALMISTALPLSAIAQSNTGNQDNFELKYKIQQSLGRASPMTLFGPVVSQDIMLEAKADGGYHVDIIEPHLFGVLPLVQLSFDLTPKGSDLFHVSNMTLPNQIELDPGTTLNIGDVDLSGDWSFEDFSYKLLDSTLHDISVKPSSGEPLVSLDALDIDVDSTDSAEIKLQLTKLSEQIIGGNQLGSASIRLFADGDQKLDIHQALSEVLTQGILNDNLPAAYQVLLTLKDKHYQQVTLEIDAEDIQLNDGYDDLGLADSFSASINLLEVTPEHWGEALAELSLDNFRSHATFDEFSWGELTSSAFDWDAESGPTSFREGIKADRVAISLNIHDVPVKALVNAFRWISTAPDNERIAVSDFYDAFLGHNLFDFQVSIDNGKMLQREIGVTLDNAAAQLALKGFEELDGSKQLNAQWSDFKIIPRTDEISPTMAREIALVGGYLPYEGDIDIAVDNLQLDLLYRLAENASFTKDSPIGLATLAPFLLSMEPIIVQQANIASNKLQLTSNSNAKLAIASLMNPVITGKSNITITGLKNLLQDIDAKQEYISHANDAEFIELMRAFIGAAIAYSNNAGENTHTWEIITEPRLDGADVTINGYPFYSNELMNGYMGMFSSMLPMWFMYGMF